VKVVAVKSIEVSRILSLCLYILVIQHARPMRHIVIFGLSGCTTFLHPTLSLKGHDFREEKRIERDVF